MIKSVDEKWISIESRLTKVETLLEDALVNHLPHLNAKIDKIQDKLDKGQYFVISTSIGVIITLALALWK